MKKIYEYSHLGGAEILLVRYPEINEQIDAVIAKVTANRIKESLEKTKRGRMLISPIDMNNQFKGHFREVGFQELRDTYTIEIPDHEVKIPGAFKQIDFCKERVLVEVQFGKYAFMFYDLAKFQYFFNEQKADVGVEIVPCHGLHKHMSSGVSYGEQLIYDVERLKRHFPSVPVRVILIDED
ncbi:MAG: BstYI [Anaerolineae bacterium]|nr:BstYI [Anaerolineae bacterium]